MQIVYKSFREILREELKKLTPMERANVSHIVVTRQEFQSLRRNAGMTHYDPLNMDDFCEEPGPSGIFQGHRILIGG